MNDRLKLIYSLIKPGKGVIDVGTDHGYLPVALAQAGYEGKILASDINAAPLASAKRNAAEAGVEGKIEFLLSDGLSACPEDAVDTVVIAGMGGDLICKILDPALWIMSGNVTLILQPMTKAEVLRYWLSNNEFEIVEEYLVEDGIIYQVLVVKYGKIKLLSDAELFSGSYELIKGSELFPLYLDGLIKRFNSIIHGLESTGKSALPGRYKLYADILLELESMRKKL